MRDVKEIDGIRDFLYQNKITLMKLNHSVDSQTQRFEYLSSYLQLSKDLDYLSIYNKKPIDQPIHILQMNEAELFAQKQKYYANKMADIKRKYSGFLKFDVVLSPEEAEMQGIEHDVCLEYQLDYLKAIRLDKSDSSCFISEIEGFVFGPFTSRFWVMRKHMNQLTSHELANAPFYAWDCLTLQIKNKGDVYLIIKNE